MSLNIKSERVHSLAREAARVTGKSQTGAVEAGLELLLSTQGHDPVATERARQLDVLRSISLAWDPHEADARVSEVDDLYDEQTGLPA